MNNISHRLQLESFTLTSRSNPEVWTDQDLAVMLEDRVVVGYILKNESLRAKQPKAILNLYTLERKRVSDETKIIDCIGLRNAYFQWIESLVEDIKSYMFRNPPLEEWLETKDNWVKKTAAKLAQTYSTPFDECLSTLYLTITDCYNRGDVYMGNLRYLIVAANNKMKLEFRYMQNRLTGKHPKAIHLDAVMSDFSSSVDEGITSLHEIIGGANDSFHEVDPNEAIAEALLKDLKLEFSEREIDQIVNMPNYLPMPLYRKLLRWRKTHKLEDYI